MGSYSMKKMSIVTDPFSGSLNSIMSKANEAVFSIDMTALQNHGEWQIAFENVILSLLICYRDCRAKLRQRVSD